MFKSFKIISIIAVINSVAIGVLFIADLLLAHYELRFILMNLIFIVITALLVWFWMTLYQKITAVYTLNQEQHIGIAYWPSIFRCLILLAIGYILIMIICFYGLLDRMLEGTALLG